MSAKADIDEYISEFPKNVQTILRKIRKLIKAAAPGSEEAMAYGIPTLKLNGKNLVHFGGHKNHIGFYPTPSGTAKFNKQLSGYKAGKGSIQFRLDEAIPHDLIEEIVRFRLTEVQEKKR
jgi:uncharacterized protein YdhG (YjbR/CyaY superfamily)